MACQRPAEEPMRAWHQQICMRLTRILDDYLAEHPVGIVFDGGDISWSADTLVQPEEEV